MIDSLILFATRESFKARRLSSDKNSAKRTILPASEFAASKNVSLSQHRDDPIHAFIDGKATGGQGQIG